TTTGTTAVLLRKAKAKIVLARRYGLMALVVPPLPSPSRPSNTTQIFPLLPLSHFWDCAGCEPRSIRCASPCAGATRIFHLPGFRPGLATCLTRADRKNLGSTG